MSKITKSFNVYGMHCKSCESSINHELENLDGILNVIANHNKSNVIVTYENSLC
ncbi:heavy metal-associated domain-containing protein [Clostridium sp. CCUG 7971]|uniref:heavy-metal-associated domain-containing protein n=1 Tax=Clostridium sp. CCUG 7971 TaxID=2811414 RepID=UPI001ABB67A5|nr:heavy metal-associated domain-containing protein [Clostridium sp. CCUG 7971]MBO3443775.1 heavy-metal-associated domain-containing protein [Clostridium sp. CCUG 7971]